MADTKKLSTARRLDGLSVVLVLCLAAIAIGAGAAFLYFRLFSAGELAVWLLVCFAFLAVELGGRSGQAPKNTNVHGTAKPASESEARAAARGNAKSAIHTQTFSD